MKKKRFPMVVPDMDRWPIVKFSRDRDAFLKELDAYVTAKIMALGNDRVQEEIARTIYLEKIRTVKEPWKIDLPDDKSFWQRTKKRLLRQSLDREEGDSIENTENILTRIVERYSNEITGRFSIKTYRLARVIFTKGLNRLLNTASARNHRRFYSSRFQLQERVKLLGAIEQIRHLSTKGTVVLVPTHFSNLDSILIGWGIDAIGLPSFSYGAGLNLFNVGALAYFMNRLGAYRVDRRKKNMIYLETLKGISNLSLQRGVHSLFFPGGTRCRSGMIEKKLKLGLLGTVMEAQRSLLQKGKKDKIFVVPLVLGYHFVLEAQSLIEDHLRRTGKEMYLVENKEPKGFWPTFKFLWRLFSAHSEILLSFGKPFDVLGNFVDGDGMSIDQRGNVIDVKDYFVSNGEVTEDKQRDEVYTNMLADRIVDRFHAENIVMSSHLVAYAAFNIFRNRNPKLDLYALLRIPASERYIKYETFEKTIKALIVALKKMETAGKVKLSDALHGDIHDLIKHGVKNSGTYHPHEPLTFDEKGNLFSENLKLLFYYHNRLEGYELARQIQWNELDLDASVKPKALAQE